MQPDFESGAVNRRRVWIGATAIAAYALAMGVLLGTLMERVRFDQKRAVVLPEYEETTARVRSRLMELEGTASLLTPALQER
jgi:hypothetical protein